MGTIFLLQVFLAGANLGLKRKNHEKVKEKKRRGERHIESRNTNFEARQKKVHF